MVRRVSIPKKDETALKNTPKPMILKKNRCKRKKTNALPLGKTLTSETLIENVEQETKALAPNLTTILAVNSPLLIV
jgi:hypothetical protein